MALLKEEREVVKQAIEIIMRETAKDGDKVILKGFGTFRRKAVAAKVARNPQNGEEITIPARSVLRFKASMKTSNNL